MVGSTPYAVRSSRRTLSVCSMSKITFDTAGCVIASCSAAFPMVPHCATLIRMCRSVRGTIEQAHFERVLDVEDRLRHCGLRDRQLLRGLSHGAALRHAH